MNFGDTVNGLFEALGALFTWRNALQLRRDREIKGVYWPITAFFALWGVWNLWYYPSLGQWLSFWAGCVLVLGNICWVVQAVRLKLRERRWSANSSKLRLADGNIVETLWSDDLPASWRNR